MRILLLGATGVLGVRLTPRLVDAGHEVVAVSRSESSRELLAGLGASMSVADVYDAAALVEAVSAAAPDMVMSQLTDLPDDADAIPDHLAANIRMRREGTDNLLEAYHASGAGRLSVQSVAWELPGEIGEAVTHMEDAVLAAGGTVLRYGQFYGAGTYHPAEPPPHPRIHLDDAAARTVDLLDAAPGIEEIVEPA